jgi:hypothetical protein
MSEHQVTDDEQQRNERRRKAWLLPFVWLATACLGALILSEALGFGNESLRAALIIGLFVAGTGVIIVQGRRVCPKCGARYGYHLRLVNQNTCRSCGAEFPSWLSDGKPDQ